MSAGLDVYGGGGTAGWKVTNVVRGSGQDPTGRYVNGYDVTFTLKSGLAGTVFVPGGSFNPDAARALIAAEAANLDAVSQLSAD